MEDDELPCLLCVGCITGTNARSGIRWALPAASFSFAWLVLRLSQMMTAQSPDLVVCAAHHTCEGVEMYGREGAAQHSTRSLPR